MSYCLACGHPNDEETGLCSNCSAEMGQSCPVCRQPVTTGSRFCGQCGARLPENTASPGEFRQSGETIGRGLIPTVESARLDSDQISRERREVTVLFLDVVNFTATAHSLDTEDVYLLIDEAMRLLVEVVYKYEGSIDKFTGDGLMALFGAPIMHENDPERAIRAALEMQVVLQPLQLRIRQAYGFDFQVRIGINTGQVIAGQVGNKLHMEYTVIGDTVNLASRLEMAAEPGTILVSFDTYQRTHPLFKFEALPPLSLKGMPEPVPVFRPLGLLARPGRVRGLPGLQVPMIGRAQDLASLRQAMAEMKREEMRWVALVTGEAGLGKSRLAAEFSRSLPLGIQVYQGTCLAYARSKPLWIIADLLRDILHLVETDPPPVQQIALRAYLHQLRLPEEMLPYLAHLLGLTQTGAGLENRLRYLDATMLQQQTHATLRQLLLAEARRAPLVLIFEDLHWIDPASRAFLEYFIKTTSEAPLLLILISRQAERETVIRPLVTAARQDPGRLVDLQLRALSRAAGQLLVEQIIHQSTAEALALKTQIAERAEGNPFFVEEIIRMLIDQDGLTGQPGSWQVTNRATSLLEEIPGTVRGLILARFDRLEPGLKRILQNAAVVGSSGPVGLLQLLNGSDPEAASVQLEQLVARQFLAARPVNRVAGYAFHHALNQEAIYGTLLKRDRQALHARVAGFIEQNNFWPPDEQIEILAYHYARSIHPERAIPFLIAAADGAARRCANETAIEHYRQAMALLPPDPQKERQEFFQVRLGLGQALKLAGDFAGAGQVLMEALRHLWQWSAAVEPAVLEPILVESLRQLADVRQREGNYGEALTYLEAGLHLLGEEAAQAQSGPWRSLLDRMALVRFRLGQWEEAFNLASLAAAGQTPEKTDDPIVLASLYSTLGGICWQQGRLDEAMEYVKYSLQLNEDLGYLWGVTQAHGNLGILYDDLGAWPAAIEHYQQAYHLQQSIGDLAGQARTLNNLGLLHVAMGQFEAAFQEFEAGVKVGQQIGDHFITTHTKANLAHLALVQGRFQEAAGLANEAAVIAETLGSTDVQIHARWVLASARAEEDLPAGLAMAEETLRLARDTGLPDEEVNICRVLGVLHQRTGKLPLALEFLQQSLTIAREIDNPYLQGKALLELGRLQQNPAKQTNPYPDEWHRKAKISLQEAIGLFTRLGAHHDLGLAQAILAQIEQAPAVTT